MTVLCYEPIILTFIFLSGIDDEPVKNETEVKPEPEDFKDDLNFNLVEEPELDFDDEEDLPLKIVKKAKKRKRPYEFACMYCKEKFSKQADLKSHVEECHNKCDTGEHKCAKCDKSFDNQKSLQRHHYLVHRDKVACTECGLMFSKNSLRQHMKDVHVSKMFKQFQCDKCDFATHAKRLLNAHFLNCHDENSKKYVCEKCSKR